MSVPRILGKMAASLLLAYVSAGIFLVLRAYLTSLESDWVAIGAAVSVFTMPLEKFASAPLVAIAWILAVYAAVSLITDTHPWIRGGTPLLVQHILRRLLVVLLPAYLCAGLFRFLQTFFGMAMPDRIPLLLMGPWSVIVGPAHAIVQDPLAGLLAILPWLLAFYVLLSLVWKIPSDTNSM